MHPYATDSVERSRVPILLVVICIPIAWVIRHYCEGLQLALPWWFDAPSVLGFYGVFYFAFDRALWKLRLLRTLGLVEVPNLNGKWQGTLMPSGAKREREVTLEIQQTWSAISIRLRTKHSASKSMIATILLAGKLDDVLSYQYWNEPKPGVAFDMHTHRGTAWLTLSSDQTRLEGEYSTGTGQKNFGTIRVSRPEKP